MNVILRATTFMFLMKSSLSLIILTLLLHSTSSIAAKPTSPNFVIILSDDQSWVGSSLKMKPEDSRTKSDYFQTPHLERLAKRGMLFTQGYAPAPFCCPTRRSLLIGQTPARHIYQKDQQNWTSNFRKQLSLPRMLKKANGNYQTAHFGKWDMRFDNVSPEQMGYDISDGITGNNTGGGKGSGGPSAKNDPKLIQSLTKRANDFMKKQAQHNKPFFIQLSHYAVHLDIFYSKDSLQKTINMAKGKKHTLPEFAAMTTDLDKGVGSLIKQIDNLGIADQTYVFFLSDNGGRLTMPGQKNKKLPRNYPLRDGKGSMYEGGLRVPFIAVGPKIDPGSISHTPITGLDLFPTMADLAGYSHQLPNTLDGGSLKNLLQNQGQGTIQRVNPFLIFHQAVARKAQTSLRLGDFKLIKTWEGNRLELFDMSKSLSEKNNIAKKLPSKTDELHQMMIQFLNEVGAETSKTTFKKKNQ
jgi:arylsulfatase A-like enzyme